MSLGLRLPVMDFYQGELEGKLITGLDFFETRCGKLR